MTRAAAAGDPIQLEIINYALIAAAEEMSVAIVRTSRSTTVRERLDYSTAVFDGKGRIIAQSARIPVHLNSMEPCLRQILAHHVPLAEWREGDVVITNDPYCGGQHLPDFLAFKPVFVEGRLVAITAILIHHVDIGGPGAGGYSADAVEIFGEGLRVPPLRIVREGVLQEDLLALMQQNVRVPDVFRGDMLSQLGALEIGARAIRSLAGRYGLPTLEQTSDLLVDSAERAMRAALRAIPDGVYDAEDFVDGDGIDPDTGAIRIRVRITVQDGALSVDFDGTSPQVKGPINCTLAATQAAVYYATIAASGLDVPANSGRYRPITIHAPAGTIVNASAPAPVSMRMLTGHRIATATLRAFAQALPQRIPASYYAVTFNHAVNIIPESGRRQVYFDSEIGGWGAHPQKDGPSGMSAGFHNGQNEPIELIEATYPIHFLRYGLVPDSGGAGERRGGLGLVREWRFDGDRGLLNANFDGFITRPYGLAGGEAGQAGHLRVRRPGTDEVSLPSKILGYPLERGDVVSMQTPGGGGHGDPARRPAADVAGDIADGYVTDSPEGAGRYAGRAQPR